MTPEYRVCPVSGRTVILAPERAARPVTLEHFAPHHRDRDPGGFCPFCPGNEWDTPESIYEISEHGEWQLRVVKNKYSAVRPSGSSAHGYHEVVIECRDHISDPLQLSDAQLTRVFIAYRERMKTMLADPAIHCVCPFKNVGAEAGASLPHLHSQILAMPFVPEVLEAELRCTANFYEQHGRDAFADMMVANDRWITNDNAYFVVCPYAPRFGYEIWIIPARASSQYEAITDLECSQLAGHLKRVLGALDRALAAPAYNWLIHTAPAPAPHYRWHLEILPRTDRAAGFEWATGIFINSTPPEFAAAHLRTTIQPR